MGFRQWMGSGSVPERQAGKSEGRHRSLGVRQVCEVPGDLGGGLWGLKQVPTPLSPAPLFCSLILFSS